MSRASSEFDPAGSGPGDPAGSGSGVRAGSGFRVPAGPEFGDPAGSGSGVPAGSEFGDPAGSGVPAGSVDPAGSGPLDPVGFEPSFGNGGAATARAASASGGTRLTHRHTPGGAWSRAWTAVLATLAVLGVQPCPAQADEVRVAVAANFKGTAEALAARFEAESGHRVLLSVGSTGGLFAQIEAGATWDLFLAADQDRPQRLEESGRGRGRFTYARGRVVLIGAALRPGADGAALLREGRGLRLAVAKSSVAPYGRASAEALQSLGVWEAWRARLVYGQSVGQAYQLAHSGAVDLALVARAQTVVSGEAAWEVPAELHAPIDQDAVLLSDAPAARAFAKFLRSDVAGGLIRAAGYELPSGSDPGARTSPGGEGEGQGERDSAWPAVWLTLRLALTTTVLLVLVGSPLAWWLARGSSLTRSVIEAAVALPLILPPTVLGFYLLVLLNPTGPIGAACQALGGPQLVFSFPGLVLGSILYSLPFVVQPLQAGFRALDPSLLEAAATLGASPWDRFRSVVLPLCRGSYLTAITLGFAHTVGEFGVVLMIGGSVPGETRVLSIAIFELVEELRYGEAHQLAGALLGLSFALLLALSIGTRRAAAQR